MRPLGLERRIRADLEGRIRSGAWPPGRRLPTEQALQLEYGCARMTVSKAIGALVAAGLVTRNRRGGSVVAHPHVQTAVLEIADLAAEVAARGEAYAFRLTSRRRRAPGAPGSDEAALAADGDLLALRGLHLAGGAPLALEDRVISLAAVPAAAEIDFSDRAPGSWLLAHVPWTEARHRISAVGAGSAEARALGRGRGTALLKIERWTFRQGEGITFVRQLFPGDRYDLTAAFGPMR